MPTKKTVSSVNAAKKTVSKTSTEKKVEPVTTKGSSTTSTKKASTTSKKVEEKKEVKVAAPVEEKKDIVKVTEEVTTKEPAKEKLTLQKLSDKLDSHCTENAASFDKLFSFNSTATNIFAATGKEIEKLQGDLKANKEVVNALVNEVNSLGFDKLKKRLISEGFKCTEPEVVDENDPPLMYNQLAYFFYDPKKVLPKDYQSEIPEGKKKFIVPLNSICNTVKEKFEAISKTGNSYVYSVFDKAVQGPIAELSLVKEFLNHLISIGKEVIVMVDDLDIKENQYKLTTKLVEENMIKFRVPYSDIVVNPDLTMSQFASNTEYSYVVLIPVNDSIGNKAIFAGYSVGTRS